MTDCIQQEILLWGNCTDEKFGKHNGETTIKTEVIEDDSYYYRQMKNGSESFKQRRGMSMYSSIFESENNVNMEHVKRLSGDYHNEEHGEDKVVKRTPSYEEITLGKTEVKEETIEEPELTSIIECLSQPKSVYNFCKVQVSDERNYRQCAEQYKSKCLTTNEDERDAGNDDDDFHANKRQGPQEDVVVYDPEKPYKCSICEKPFKRRGHLTDHMKVHDIQRKKKFKCELCNISYYDKRGLRTHLNKKHLHNHSEKEKSYKCNHCDYSTCDKSNLSAHTRVHTDERPYMCNYPMCNYKSRQSNYLKYHIRQCHTFEKPLKCLHCFYSTAQKSNLKKHVRRMHNENLL